MLSMFINDRRDNWHELLPYTYVMHAYRTSIHESTGYSPFRLMMGEECSLPQNVSTAELRTHLEHDISPHPFATWVRDALEVAYDHVRESLHRTAARRKQLYDIKAVNRKFPVGSWVLRYYPPAAQLKLGSPWIGPNQVLRQATGHGVSTAKSLCASTVAFTPGSHVSDITLTPSVDVSGLEDTDSHHSRSTAVNELDSPIDLTRHVLSPFYIRNIDYQDSRFNSIAHLMCYRYAVTAGQKTFATGIRKWSDTNT